MGGLSKAEVDSPKGENIDRISETITNEAWIEMFVHILKTAKKAIDCKMNHHNPCYKGEWTCQKCKRDSRRMFLEGNEYWNIFSTTAKVLGITREDLLKRVYMANPCIPLDKRGRIRS